MYRILLGVYLVCILVPVGVLAEPWDFSGGVGPSFGTTFRESEKDGFGAQAHFEVGLTETLSLSLGGGYIRHCVGAGDAYSLGNTTLGLMYNLDVLVMVPFAGVRLGWLYQGFHSERTVQGLALSVSIGFDYLWTDSFSVGFAAEYLGLLTNFGSFPAYTSFTARVGFRLPH